MKIGTSKLNGWHVVSLDGNLDQAGSTVLAKTLEHVPGSASLALDLAALNYITSAGFRILLTTEKKHRQAGGRLFVGNLKDSVLQIFEIAGLSEIIVIAQNLQGTIAPDA